jgi:hypothetical protein
MVQSFPLMAAGWHADMHPALFVRTEYTPALLEDFYAREVLHVTFGSVLTQYGVELKTALIKHDGAYYDGLKAHFDKHLSLLK